ncbi:stage II sporulation protein M [Clostridium sp. YIM B02515]|uniref:Stage II sporulation protein M n=1 Tax=Clostridium rhizosphaerae TaxID=2803861 RepID=A0ABS1TEX0_9CLOT|nr:stage II sporulation protein M [Clostridium rhizosphaerae]MBL4937895.1 stage II sporulation protein M [Clostridium rhizosphaerae]
MSNRKITTSLNEHLQQNFWLYVISLFCVFTGIVLGIYAVKYMNNVENSDLLSYFTNFNQNISNGDFKYSMIISDIIKNNISIILAVWFLGLTMVGIPIILIIDIIKGFTLGFTISFIVKGLGTKGIGVILIGILPQNIIYIPCIIIASVVAMEFSLSILREKMNKQWVSSIWMKITSYSFIFILISVLMGVGFLLEAYATPNLIKIII